MGAYFVTFVYFVKGEKKMASRLLELVEEAKREIRERHERDKAAGKGMFSCRKCSTRFDTSVGRAWHEANNCADVPRPPLEIASLPSCPKCHSFALYRNQDGSIECATCGVRV